MDKIIKFITDNAVEALPAIFFVALFLGLTISGKLGDLISVLSSWVYGG